MMLEVLHGILAGMMVMVTIAWLVLLRGIIRTFRLTPHIRMYSQSSQARPKVSVILPARNEEKYIGRCLDSLAKQDYAEYEVIAVNDSSDDSTESIISDYANKHTKIRLVNARPKPEGWMGKNWACMEGYDNATGQILLFTDSDTVFSPNMISAAIDHLNAESLDALTAIPLIRTNEFWTRITLPMISTFLHTRFSALNVNDPNKKTGYFFGSFFVMPKNVYESVGTHKGVRQEIIEDGSLGRKVKDMGYNLKMVLADDMFEAIWARDGSTLWHALKRLMIPLYLQCSKTAVGIFVALLSLLLLPFPTLLYSVTLDSNIISEVLWWSSLAASFMILCGAIIESHVLKIKLYNALACPLGGAVIVAGFFAGILSVGKQNSVSWRGRKYTLRHTSQNPMDV